MSAQQGPEPFRFHRSGRSWATLGAVVLTWVLCLLGLLVFNAAGWIVALILLFSLPAIWDLYAGSAAGTEIENSEIAWYSGNREARVGFDEIDHVRLVTRLDLSVRAAVVLNSGRKLRLPPEATPPVRLLEPALAAHGLKTERHHFTFL